MKFMQSSGLPEGVRPVDLPVDGNDVKQLANDIAQLSGDDRDLAVDMLVNLAAGTDPRSKDAQATLRNLYADPNEFSGANQLQEHGKQEVRACLKAAAHRMCDLALSANALPRAGGDQPLSATVAYLGGRCEPPAGTPVTEDRVQTYLEQQIQSGGSTLNAGDKLLAPGRYATECELAGAARNLSALPVHSTPLNMNITGRSAEVVGAMFTDPLKELLLAVQAKAGPACQAAWIHTGDDSFAHWMPLVIHKDNAGRLQCHVLDTHSDAPSSRRIRDDLLALLVDAGVDPATVTFHSAEMQTHAPNACGPLGHGMLKALDKELVDSIDHANGADVSGCIDQYIQGWCNLPPSDQEAGALSARAELLQAWPGAEHAPSLVEPGFLTNSPAPAPAPKDLEQVRQFAQHVGLSRGKDEIHPETDKRTPTYTSAFADLSRYANALAGVTEKSAKPDSRLLASVQMGDQFKKLPDSMKPLARALQAVQYATSDLGTSPLLTGDPTRMKLINLRKNLGVDALASQLPTRINLALRAALTLAGEVHEEKGTNSRHLTQFGQALAEVDYATKQIATIEAAMKELVDIAALDPAVRADAHRLRGALVELRDALMDPAGIAQQLNGFVKTATSDLAQAAAILSAALAS